MKRTTLIGVALAMAIGVATTVAFAQNGNVDISGMLDSLKLSHMVLRNGRSMAYLVPFKSDSVPDLKVFIAPSPNGRFLTIYAKIVDLPATVDEAVVYRALIEEQTGKIWLGKFVRSEGSLHIAIETSTRRLDPEELGSLVQAVARYVDENYTRFKDLVNGRVSNGNGNAPKT
jgi:hypothetical protein